MALAVAVLVTSGCGSSSDAVPPASVTLPAYPYAANTSIVVDEAALAADGGRFCRRTRGRGTAVDFYLGNLALGSVDRICDASAPGAAEVLLGNLYVSGYFGGIWLRDSLADRSSVSAARAAQEVVGMGLGDTVFASLAKLAAKQLDRARNAPGGELIDAAHASLPLLLTLYGYNLGYIQVAVENPPAGNPTTTSPISCDGFLACSGTAVDLATLEQYAPALREIAAPPSDAWREVADDVSRFGEGSVAAGRGVWEGILGGSAIAGAAYQPLLDLSAGYLLVSEAAVLANAVAFAESDASAARCGALVQTGLVIWSGSYFEGLASPAPPGTFPTLECPG